MLIAMGFGYAITGFIVVLNTIIKIISIAMIQWIGYDTHSEMLTKITNGVFFALFFNTAIIVLLVDANLTETFPPLGHFFNGGFSDYSPACYASVGFTLTQTLFFNAFMGPPT